MVDWLFAPIESTRAHEVGVWVSWHGRLMVLAWGVLLPLGVLIARYFKIMPGQDWPREVDNRIWWHSHLTLQYSGGVATLVALVLIFWAPRTGTAGNVHIVLGWVVAGLACLQFLSGWLRGSKGGPTDASPDGSLAGDHYDMTLRRRVFEHFHKSAGYVLVLLALAAVVTGMWLANALVWMWVGLAGWWAVLGVAFVVLHRRGLTIDTYQAIWGPDRRHPGNTVKPIGWGVRRREDVPKPDGVDNAAYH